ncbi:hypothetical protein [Acetivibrio cellulolyticus]|uniref:hypothetical protein n=1 Tax=Acetivibrio cellulolyticus TaxID=35830 RepID=UPI0001E2D979|nr:hypothetical protein [Acetivibrio cellulolyticus]
MSKETSLFDLITSRSMEDVYEDIGEKLKSNKKYNNYIEEIHNKLSNDPKLKSEICNKVADVEAEVTDTAYSQGFSDAVKLLMNCMSF